MRNFILAAGAAALAIAAPAVADPKGQGGGKAQGSAKAQGGAKGGQPGNGGGARAERPAKADRGPMKAAGNEARPGREAKADRPQRAERSVQRAAEKAERAADNRLQREARGDGVQSARDAVRTLVVSGPGYARAPGLSCPPGLERKNNGCMPPGQAMKQLGAPLAASFASAQLPYQYRNWFADSDDYMYRAGDGFIYRVKRSDNLVDGLIPLFGTGYYAMGDPWPQPYDFYNVPDQYRTMWSDGDDYRYRYSDGAIYRLDPRTNAVNAIVALLAGDLGVGARLPAAYDVYNVPLQYRSQYADRDDAWYRYNDGYIYQVDPTTRLITAVIDAII